MNALYSRDRKESIQSMGTEQARARGQEEAGSVWERGKHPVQLAPHGKASNDGADRTGCGALVYLIMKAGTEVVGAEEAIHPGIRY